MFFNLLFLGKDQESNEDKVIFELKSLKAQMEVFVDKKKYVFTIVNKKEVLKSFSITDKKLGNNKSAIELKSIFYNELNQREELILNLGYNGSNAFIYSDKDGISIELINPIGENVKSLFYFYDDLISEEI